MRRWITAVFYGGTLALLAACGGGSGGGSSPDDTSDATEADYCGSALQSPSPRVTVTGTANYEFRVADSSGLTNTIGTRPIRFAEVRVTDAAGSLVQCSETDSSGNISLNLPADGSSYTVSVTSRADNDNSRVSVLDTPDTMNFYSLSQTITASGSPVVAVTAEAKGSVIGGAFNIYDQIVTTNQFLKSKLANCNSSGSDVNGPTVDCQAFATSGSFVPSGKTSKATVFWKAGVNPNVYIGGSESSGLSFYSPDTDQLFILGGISGDTDNTDTDHFDNSVIIHEYGHFLEDQYAISDSPGGSHNGNSVLDPRLVWSEGWANFIQAAVTQDAGTTTTPRYQDTTGNADGSTSNFFFTNLEFRCDSDNENGTCVDQPTSVGEGNFREFSITRVLWDMIDVGTNSSDGQDTFTTPSTYTDTFSMPFAEVWTAFINLRGSLAFRSVGNFHELRNSLTGDVKSSSDYNSLVASAFQQPNRSDYANPISSLPGSCTTTLSLSGSNQFLAHDYYDYNHAGGSLKLDLTYSLQTTDDLDLYIYREGYVLFSTSDFVGVSNDEDDGGSESITLSSLSAGHYLIDVHYFAGSGSEDYVLNITNNSVTSAKVCPKTSF